MAGGVNFRGSFLLIITQRLGSTHTHWLIYFDSCNTHTHTQKRKEKNWEKKKRVIIIWLELISWSVFFRGGLLHKSSWRLGPRNDNVFIVSYKNKSRKRHPAVGWCQAFWDNDDNQNGYSLRSCCVAPCGKGGIKDDGDNKRWLRNEKDTAADATSTQENVPRVCVCVCVGGGGISSSIGSHIFPPVGS